MGLAFRQLKTYAKLALMVVIALAVLSVIVMNMGQKHRVDVWLFRPIQQINVLWVMLVSGASAVVIIWVLGRARKVIRDLREVRRARAMEAQMDEQRQIAEEVKERENRIDAKVQDAIGRPDEPSTRE